MEGIQEVPKVLMVLSNSTCTKEVLNERPKYRSPGLI